MRSNLIKRNKNFENYKMIFEQIAGPSVTHYQFALEAVPYPSEQDSNGDSDSQDAQVVDDPCLIDQKANL